MTHEDLLLPTNRLASVMRAGALKPLIFPTMPDEKIPNSRDFFFFFFSPFVYVWKEEYVIVADASNFLLRQLSHWFAKASFFLLGGALLRNEEFISTSLEQESLGVEENGHSIWKEMRDLGDQQSNTSWRLVLLSRKDRNSKAEMNHWYSWATRESRRPRLSSYYEISSEGVFVADGNT